MGSKISVLNDTNEDWICKFTLRGGGRPAGGYNRKILRANCGESVCSEFTLMLPVVIAVRPINSASGAY